jgi:23S rRNA pseudouridine2605 synthase
VRPPAGPRTYLLLNKPRGFVTTVSDEKGRDTVLDLIPSRLRRAVKPVGRLDVQTEGLLLLTDDGALARLVTHPSTGCTKEYQVKVSGEPTEAQLARLRDGVLLEDGRTRPCRIDRISATARKGGDEGNTWLRVTLQEGRSRQIRRMFESIGHPVSKLKRVAIGPVRDPKLPPGAFRPLSDREVTALRRLGEGEPSPSRATPGARR